MENVKKILENFWFVDRKRVKKENYVKAAYLGGFFILLLLEYAT